MTKDYTKVPGYEGMTQPQARYNYLHDLLDAYMRLTPEDRTAMVPCKVREERGDCRYCSFSGFLGGDPEVCCAWRAEAQPDKAIEILEMLLDRRPTETKPTRVIEPRTGAEKIRTIARHYGKEKGTADRRRTGGVRRAHSGPQQNPPERRNRESPG